MKQFLRPGATWAVGFTLFYLLLISMFSYETQNWEFMFYVFVVLFSLLFFLFLHRYVHFTSGAFWTLSIVGLMHMTGGIIAVPEWFPLGGESPVLYNVWIIPNILKYDHVIHLYGYGVCTWLMWQVMHPLIKGEESHPSELLIAVLAANGIGAWNEIIEFIVTNIVTHHNVGGYINTGWDLVSNLVGSVVALFVIRYGHPIKTKT